jgi:DNA-binding NarL/FixJ family response regulator
MSIRIAIADDHPMVITGLQNMLSGYPHITIVGVYPNVVELLKGMKLNLPDVLLLDIQLPDKTGDELAPVLLKKYPQLRILILTNFNSTLYVNNMLRHGVLGYLLKTTDNKTLVEAIETVYKGEEFLQPSIKEKIDQADKRIKREVSTKSALSIREKQILQLIVNGDSNQQIADSLFLSLRTVENYRFNLAFKLDAKNTAMLVSKALKLGLAE